MTEAKPGIKLSGRTPADPQVGLADQVKALLPTPNAGNFNDGEDLENWERRRAEQKELGRNGNGMGTPLAIAVRLLPTPRTSDTNGAGEHGDGGPDLRSAVALLPTPRVAATRTSRKAMTENQQWSAPSLEQAVELAAGQLPREFESWDQVPGWHGQLLPTPTGRDGKGPNPNSREGGPDLPGALTSQPSDDGSTSSDDGHPTLWTTEDD